MKSKDTKNIELVVLNCFIRTMKSSGKYMLYRCGVNNKGIMGILLKARKLHTPDSPFSYCSSTVEVVKALERITNEMARSNGKKGGAKDLDKYEHVTMTINHLLHFFVESNGVPMEKLCSMGEEIYNLSCHKLFGDTLEDLQQQEVVELNNIEDAGQLKAKLFQDYIREIQNGQLNRSITFDDYLRVHADEFNKFRGKKKSSNINAVENNSGSLLGMGPEGGDNMFIRKIRRPSWLDDITELSTDNDDNWEDFDYYDVDR